MSILNFIKKQFIDVIEMPEMDSEILVKKYPMQDQEIQYGAQLVVRESQMAVFVNEGKLADVFGPGTYKLTTNTIPLLTNLKNWDKLFQSPFKSDVYFLSSRVQINAGWGTPQAISIRDKDFGIIRVRAFGQYNYQIDNPGEFFKTISGTTDEYTKGQLESQLKNVVVSNFANFLAQSGVPFLDMAANQGALADKIKEHLTEAFKKYGVKIHEFLINNLNLPEEIQKAFDQKASMGVIGDMGKFTQYQAASSIPLAASNEGGIAGVGASMGAGLAMGQIMQQALSQPQPTVASAAPSLEEDIEAKLTKAKGLLDKGLISEQDYQKLKTDLLSKLL